MSVNHPQSPLRRLLSDSSLQAVLPFLQRLQGLILLPVLLNQAGIAAYGLWSQFITLGMGFDEILNALFYNPIVRFVPGALQVKEKQDIFFSLSILLVFTAALLFACMLIFSDPLSTILFADRQYGILVTLLAFFIFISGLDGLGNSMLRALFQVKIMVVLQIIQVICRLLACLWAASQYKTLLATLIAYMVVFLIFSVFKMVITLRFTGFQVPRFTHIRSLLTYGLPLLPDRVSRLILRFADRWMILYFWGAESAGLYSACYDLTQVLPMILSPFNQALQPLASQLWDHGETAQVKKLITQTLKICLFIGLPATAGMVAVAPNLYTLLSGSDFIKAAHLVTPFVAPAALLNFLAVFAIIPLQLEKKTAPIMRSTLIAAFFHLALISIGVPLWGLLGASIATLAGYLLWIILLTLTVPKEAKFSFPYRTLFALLVATCFMFPLAWLTGQGTGWGIFFRSVAIGVISYLLLAFLFKGITLPEIHSFMRLWAGKTVTAK